MAKVKIDSRYATSRVLEDEDGVQFLDWFRDIQFDVEQFSDNVQYRTLPEDTVFSIASNLYEKQKYFWVVCRANLILNPFEKLTAGTVLVLPSFRTFKTRIIGGGQ